MHQDTDVADTICQLHVILFLDQMFDNRIYSSAFAICVILFWDKMFDNWI
jgi:hypothetical protein